jgi:hypothetical protein
MNTNTLVTLLFHLLSENLPKDVVYFIITEHYVVQLRLKAFFKEKYYHGDFSGGEDNILRKSGIKVKRLKSFQGRLLTHLNWKESNSFWRRNLLVSSMISVIKHEKGYKIYSDLDKDFDMSKGTIYSSKEKTSELEEEHFNTWSDDFMNGYDKLNLFYDKCIDSTSIFRDHKCAGSDGCKSRRVKKVMYHGKLVYIYKNDCDVQTKEYLEIYYKQYVGGKVYPDLPFVERICIQDDVEVDDI